jgi:hypothetical protein
MARSLQHGSTYDIEEMQDACDSPYVFIEDLVIAPECSLEA